MPFPNASAIAVSHNFQGANARLVKTDAIGSTDKYFKEVQNNLGPVRTIIQTTAQKYECTIEVVVCRSGQALHNGDKQIPNKLDSSLTLAGMEQAYMLGQAITNGIDEGRPVVVIPIASYLNRSQHTALLCIDSMAKKLDTAIDPKLSSLLQTFNETSINRKCELRGLNENRTNKNLKDKIDAINGSYVKRPITQPQNKSWLDYVELIITSSEVGRG